MYLPRQDKFEGYAQLPRPKLPPEGGSQHQTQSRAKFGSLLSRAEGTETKIKGVERGSGAASVNQGEAMSIKELLEIQLKKK